MPLSAVCLQELLYRAQVRMSKYRSNDEEDKGFIMVARFDSVGCGGRWAGVREGMDTGAIEIQRLACMVPRSI